MSSLAAEFNSALNSIDLGLDNASKLINQSQQYVTSSKKISSPLQSQLNNRTLSPTIQETKGQRKQYNRNKSSNAIIPKEKVTNLSRLQQTDRALTYDNYSSSSADNFSSSNLRISPLPTDRLNGHSQVRLRQACKTADSDGDGLLTMSEFTRVLGKMGIEITKQEANQLCSKYNNDRNSSSSSSSSSSNNVTKNDGSKTLSTRSTTLSLQKDAIDYDLFVRGLSNQPLRSSNSIARDAAKHIYKQTGETSQQFVRSLRKADTDCTGKLSRSELEKKL